MPLVSLTRLRLRAFWYLPPFFWFSLLSTRQARRAPGFLGGQFASEPGLGFWTVTLWQDEASMRAFRNADPHRRAMPRLIDWCDEASYAHWPQDGLALPSLDEAKRRMIADGQVSKVRHPTPAHARKEIAPAAGPLRRGLALQPRR